MRERYSKILMMVNQGNKLIIDSKIWGISFGGSFIKAERCTFLSLEGRVPQRRTLQNFVGRIDGAHRNRKYLQGYTAVNASDLGNASKAFFFLTVGRINSRRGTVLATRQAKLFTSV